MSTPTDLKILLTLCEKRKLNKRSLDDDTGLHPKITQNHLKKLIKEGYIHEEGRESWKRGKKIFYSLTAEGKEQLITAAGELLNPTFRTIQRITEVIASKPNELERFRAFLKENPPFPQPTEEEDKIGSYFKETIDQYLEDIERIKGPLRDAFVTMFRIYLEVWGPRKPSGELQDVAVTLTKEGYVDTIPIALLKKHG